MLRTPSSLAFLLVLSLTACDSGTDTSSVVLDGTYEFSGSAGGVQRVVLRVTFDDARPGDATTADLYFSTSPNAGVPTFRTGSVAATISETGSISLNGEISTPEGYTQTFAATGSPQSERSITLSMSEPFSASGLVLER